MSVDVLITHETPPLRPLDCVEYALGLMMEMRVRHLPVVDEVAHLVGIISEDDLLGSAGPDEPVGSRLQGTPVHVAATDHVFEVTRIIMNHGLSMVPVVGADERYGGLIRRHDLFERFAAMLGTQSTGAILALEEDKRDAALSKIVYLVEQNDVRVLSLATEEMPDDHIGITLKLNVRDATRVRHILEHNGYHVVAAFGEEEDSDGLMDRVQEFMRYLEV